VASATPRSVRAALQRANARAPTMEQSRSRVACATICLVEAVLCAYASASMKERILSSVVTMAGRYVTVIM
jgi:hypothetical protein